MWVAQKKGRRIFYGPENFGIEISTGPNTSKLFPEKKDTLRRASFVGNPFFFNFPVVGHAKKLCVEYSTGPEISI